MFTTTVASAQQVDEDAVRVNLAHVGASGWFPEPLLLVPGAMFFDKGPGLDDRDLPGAWLETPEPPRGDHDCYESREDERPGFLRLPPALGKCFPRLKGWTEPSLTTVTTPAGQFEDCVAMGGDFTVNGGGHGSKYWCPGVGFVRNVDPGCGVSGGTVTVTQLEEWHIPEIIVVP